MTIIRQAEPRDAAAIARVHVDTWRTTYAGLLPDRVLLNLDSVEQESRWWRSVLKRQRKKHWVLVAEDERAGVIGFGSAGPTRDRDLPYQGEIYTIYLRDDFQGAGVGRRLFVALSEKLLAEQGRSIIVWVLRQNPARFFYQSLGGRWVARRPGTLGGAPIEEYAFGWEDVTDLVALGRSFEA